MENNGYFSNSGTIWHTCGDDGSVRILYMETKPIHSKNSNAGVRSVDKKGSFDQFIKDAKSKNLSLRLKKIKKSLDFF